MAVHVTTLVAIIQTFVLYSDEKHIQLLVILRHVGFFMRYTDYSEPNFKCSKGLIKCLTVNILPSTSKQPM